MMMFFAPHLYLPWSGSIAQRIEPNTNWFFDTIYGEAGNGRIEKKAFEEASYGKQLGLISEVLLAIAEKDNDLGKKAAESLNRLKEIYIKIEAIKIEQAAITALEIERQLKWLKEKSPSDYNSLAPKLRAIIN